MKDVTTTSFGLIIAYLLPGLVGLYCLTFWFTSLKSISQTFLAAKADLGLSLMILAAAVVVGLQINVVRFVLYERILCRAGRVSPEKLKAITDQQKVAVFTTFIEENFRYHQFYGSMTVLTPVLYAALLNHVNSYLATHFWFIFLTTVFTFIVASLVFLLYELKEGSAGLKEFLWCYERLKNLLSIKIGRGTMKLAIWISLAFTLLIYLVWLYCYQGISNRSSIVLFTLGFVTLEIATGAGAIFALRVYRERTRLLKGESD